MKKTTLIFWILALGLSACNLEETNINPNDPVDVPLQTLLPPAMEATAEVHAEEAAVIAGIFSNYFKGVDNRALPVESYLLDESFNMNPLWQDFYNTPIDVLKLIVRKAEQQNAPHYEGVGLTLLALCTGTASSLWGDIPFTEAGLGGENFSPAYDPQEALYGELQALLDRAIVALDAPESVFSPGDDDVLFGGDRQRWKKVAYALKARYYMHTVKVDAGAPQKALDALANAFAGPQDELSYPYGFNEAEQNPWFLYFQNTPYVQIDEDFQSLLDGTDDPRQDELIRTSFGVSRVGDYLSSTDSPVPLLTYVETKLLEAEALVRLGQGDPQSIVEEAVRTHIAQVTDNQATEEEIDNYLAAHVQLTGDENEDLNTILTQQYIAHFTMAEGWTDYRRTGYPELVPNPDGDNPQNPGGAIPRRFIYPQNERLYNTQFPPDNPNLQDRFWWDGN